MKITPLISETLARFSDQKTITKPLRLSFFWRKKKNIPATFYF